MSRCRAVVGVAGALPTGTLLFPAADSNMAAESAQMTRTTRSSRAATRSSSATIVNQRLAPMPLEGRRRGRLLGRRTADLWLSTQNAQIAGSSWPEPGLDPAAIRVITPDVGGGFGAKVGIDRDATWSPGRPGDRPAAALGETRSENLVGMTHGRAQRADHQARRDPGRPDPRLPARRGAGHRRVPADERFLAILTELMSSGPYEIPRVRAATGWW